MALPAGPTAAQAEQDACTSEAEPNDAPELAATLRSPVCVSGTLPDGDQDLYLWEVSAAEATTPRTLVLEGVPGTLTALQVLPITSEPGVTPPAVGGAVLTVSSDPLAGGPTTEPGILLPPGRYLLGISRSPLPDGSSPTGVDYGFAIEPGAGLLPDTEPNDDATTAVPVAGAFAVSGDASGSSDVYAWTLSEEDAARAWQLDVQGQVGASNFLTLADEAGDQLATMSADPLGRSHLFDLRLVPGTYLLSMSDLGDGVHPYAISSTASEPGLSDAEPNDDAAHAVPLDPAGGVGRGRLARASDVDDFRFTVDADLAAVQLDITLLSRGQAWRQLCLMGADDVSLQCRSGPGGTVLRGLLLPQGEHYLEVSGDSSLSEPYLLRLDRTSPPVPDFETRAERHAVDGDALRGRDDHPWTSIGRRPRHVRLHRDRLPSALAGGCDR